MSSAIFRAALAALSLALAAGPGAAQQLLDQYSAYIGQQDLFNSKGGRLWEPWQVLRQDRANFHRFGLRDAADQGDAFFADPNNRAAMEQMLMNGRIDPQSAAAIVNGGVTVVVQVWGYGGQGRSVSVAVYR